MDLAHKIRDKMMKEHLMFVYRGVITNENSIPLLLLLEKEMESSEFSFVGRKRLFMFVLESLQNVSRHSDNNEMAGMSLVVYTKAEGGYTVSTGNVISTSGIDDLKHRLDDINNLETGEIRSVYRQMLSNSEFSRKGGAGLGLIEMAKKTGNKLDYDFVELDDKNSYFILSKTVDSEGVGSHEGREEKHFNGKAIAGLEKLMADNCVYLIWSGHISPDIGTEVLSFTETRLSEDDIEWKQRKRVFSILIEMLENVAKYSPGKANEEKHGMPVAMIRLKDRVYSLTTGNLILNSSIAKLKEKLDEINNCDREELKELMRQSILSQSPGNDSTGNMGLIDMARKSRSKLTYSFDKVSSDFSYYTLTVNINSD